MKEVTDQSIGQRARTPQELVELYSDEIWRFASSQLSRREDAEDVVMEVFAVACGSFMKLRRAENQRLWLLTVARRKVANVLRQRYRRAEQPLSEGYLTQEERDSELHEQVRVAMKALPSNQAEVLVLKYVNGLSIEEVARVIRKSLPATNSLLQRARGAVRDAIGPSTFDNARSLS